MKRPLLFALLGFTVFLATGCKGGTRLNGAGSSFVKPMMDRWAKGYKDEKKVEINYQSKGSSAGVADVTDKTVDFGCSDAPLNDDQLARAAKGGGPVAHVPLVMGGVVLAYNLEGLKEPLNFTGEVIADIYLGKITRWNDSALKALNTGRDLPDEEIKTAHRSDGSGTTFIFTDYLSKVSPTWEKQVHFGNEVKWPGSGKGQKGSEGVGGYVQKTKFALGYVELIYALGNNIPYGKVKNKAGKFILPSLESVTASAKGFQFPPDLRYSLTDAPGEDAYPISGTTWAVVFVDQTGNKNGQALVDCLRWLTHEGQQYTKELSYARLPSELIKIIEEKLGQIKVK